MTITEVKPGSPARGGDLWGTRSHHPFPRRAPTLEEVRAAAQAHEQGRVAHANAGEGASSTSDYIGNLVYGGLDGIITTFAVVSGVVGATLAPQIILILGASNLIADGFSMAVGAYLSAKSEQEVYAREREHISERIVRSPEKEKEALRALYRDQGYSEDDARRMVEMATRDPGRWVSTVMAETLLLLPQKRKPILEGLAAFIAFGVAGSIPLLVYVADFLLPFQLAGAQAFLLALILSGLALFGLGAAKVWVTRGSPLRSGVEMLLVGGVAAAVAYGIGMVLKSVFGL